MTASLYHCLDCFYGSMANPSTVKYNEVNLRLNERVITNSGVSGGISGNKDHYHLFWQDSQEVFESPLWQIVLNSTGQMPNWPV